MNFPKICAKWVTVLAAGALFLMSAAPNNAQLPFHKKKKVNKSTSAENTAEPDKLLYNRALEDIKHGRHEVGRLNMQTLINTYPDSEYLADAKLAIADSYFKEGGTANTTQAIQAYMDYGVFFPMLEKAGYAQLQVAMAHYRQIEKPDRDRTQAREAEDAFQTFLQKYPKDPLVSKAEQHLREVQEILAEGDYRIGYFYYYTRQDKRAAASRLAALVSRYPLYSKSDRALWMLGSIWEGTEKKELAAPYYARIVRDYPLSPLVPQAKDKLKSLKAPVPQPDPKAVAWMTAEANTPRPHESFAKKPLELMHSGPKQEKFSAARTGTPTMTPESDNEAGLDILTGGNQSRVGGTGTGIVATVSPGTTGEATGAAESVAPAGAAADPAKSDTPAATTETGAADATKPDAATGTTGTGTADASTKTEATSGDSAGTGQAADGTKTDGTSAQGASQTDNQNGNNDNKKESSSKKKKGLKKIIPW